MHKVQSSDTWLIYRQDWWVFCWGLKARQRGGAAGSNGTVRTLKFPITPSLRSTRTPASSSGRPAAFSKPSALTGRSTSWGFFLKLFYKENSWTFCSQILWCKDLLLFWVLHDFQCHLFGFWTDKKRQVKASPAAPSPKISHRLTEDEKKHLLFSKLT